MPNHDHYYSLFLRYYFSVDFSQIVNTSIAVIVTNLMPSMLSLSLLSPYSLSPRHLKLILHLSSPMDTADAHLFPLPASPTLLSLSLPKKNYQMLIIFTLYFKIH